MSGLGLCLGTVPSWDCPQRMLPWGQPHKGAIPDESDPQMRPLADFLSNFDEAITAAKKELELWKQLKKALLQQMSV